MILSDWRKEFSGVFQGWCAGSRGSRPATSGAIAFHEPDADTNFDYISHDFTKYGGETTSFGFAIYGNNPEETEFIIIDNGTGVIALTEHYIIPVAKTAAKLGLQSISIYCFHTHFHDDHTDGLKGNKLFFFGELPIHITFYSPALPDLKSSSKDRPLTETMMIDSFPGGKGYKFPVPLEALTAQIKHIEFDVGERLSLRDDLVVDTCLLPHPGGACGYKIKRQGYEPFTYMTDCDFGSDPSDKVIHFMESEEDLDCGIHYHDLQFTNGQYDGKKATKDGIVLPRGRTETNPGWGHNCPRNLFLAVQRCKRKPRQLICGHHDPSNYDIILDRRAKYLRKEARRQKMNPKMFQLARGLGKTRPKILKLR